MGRYDRNRSNKSNAATFFIVAAMIAFGIGAAGTYYIFKTKNAAEPQINKTEEPKNDISDISIVNNPSIKSPFPGNKKLALLSPDPNVVIRDIKTFPLPTQLPDLLGSDNIFRQTVTRLSPGFAPWLDSDQLIRKFIIVANDFAQGIRVADHMSFMRLAQPFVVEQGENALVVSPKSYQRYDALCQAIQGVNPSVAVAVYQVFRPLMQQVFVEFAYPQDITLESVIQKGAADMLAAPVIEEPIGLVRPSVHYKFADKNLEMLSPVQKQMLRMGPENTRIIQTKIRELMVELAKLDFK